MGEREGGRGEAGWMDGSTTHLIRLIGAKRSLKKQSLHFLPFPDSLPLPHPPQCNYETKTRQEKPPPRGDDIMECDCRDQGQRVSGFIVYVCLVGVGVCLCGCMYNHACACARTHTSHSRSLPRPPSSTLTNTQTQTHKKNTHTTRHGTGEGRPNLRGRPLPQPRHHDGVPALLQDRLRQPAAAVKKINLNRLFFYVACFTTDAISRLCPPPLSASLESPFAIFTAAHYSTPPFPPHLNHKMNAAAGRACGRRRRCGPRGTRGGGSTSRRTSR